MGIRYKKYKNLEEGFKEMNLAELKQKLINNNLDPLYIFFGEEIGIMDKYIESIKKKSNKGIIRIESLKELLLK